MTPEKHELEEIREALQEAYPPARMGPGKDLWPAMRERLEGRPLRVPWYDWALAGGLAGAAALFPKLLLFFAYHL